MSPQNTYVLAVSACPPWKDATLPSPNVARACRRGVEDFVAATVGAFALPRTNIFTLVDAQATYEGLEDGIGDLARRIPTTGRVILFFNLHGVELYGIRSNSSAAEESLVLWTEEKPFSILTAIEFKQWITAQELRAMIDRIDAREVVVIIDACHSASAVPDLIHKHNRGSNWPGREAVIVSAKPAQIGNFNMDWSEALFTSNLSGALRAGFPTLEKAFQAAAKKTHAESIAICAKPYLSKHVSRKTCEQTPEAYDPRHLLDSIKLRAKGPRL